MQINGTLVNYYFHCKRQCYLHGNRMNLEDNSEQVKIGRALHQECANGKENAELAIGNIKIDKLTREYLTEIKKSDADQEAAKWQLLFYLKELKSKGIVRKGKLEYIEKNKSSHKVEIIELTNDDEKRLDELKKQIEVLMESEEVPDVLNQPKCKKCAYYCYCYI